MQWSITSKRGGKSRGSALYTDPNGLLPDEDLPEIFRLPLMTVRAAIGRRKIHVMGRTEFEEKVQAIPKEDDFFENVAKFWENWQCILKLRG